jgi:transposase
LGEYLRTRWQAGVQDATQLWQELRERGYHGTARAVQRTVAPWRDGPVLRGQHAHRVHPPSAAPRDQHPPSARQAVWLLLRPLDALTIEEQHIRRRVLAAAPEVEQAHTAISTFRCLLRERDGAALEPWLAKTEGSAVRELRAFAASIRKDQAAIQAALDYAWSSGRVEGHITRIKLVRRQMYGRGSVDLLKRRVMLAS